MASNRDRFKSAGDKRRASRAMRGSKVDSVARRYPAKVAEERADSSYSDADRAAFGKGKGA